MMIDNRAGLGTREHTPQVFDHVEAHRRVVTDLAYAAPDYLGVFPFGQPLHAMHRKRYLDPGVYTLHTFQVKPGLSPVDAVRVPDGREAENRTPG
jgi:hypothetical protein